MKLLIVIIAIAFPALAFSQAMRKEQQAKVVAGVQIIKRSVVSDSTRISFHCAARSTPAGSEPLLIVDCTETDISLLKTVNPHDIESINILKDKEAVKKYGAKAKNGVIIITMKPKCVPAV